jgi:VIT1/CCC1 family predicted Fe2+/Mn2+ transporter
MTAEFIALGGAVGIAVFVFVVIIALADKPVKAFIVALMLSYTLFALLIYIISRIVKHKEENHATEMRYE